MQQTKLYKILPLDVPEEVKKAYWAAVRDRDRAASMIKAYTDSWVKAQEKIIELEQYIFGRGKDDANRNR